ncbi:MAG: PEP-CTERM sorting domain-containing protein [Planctomycetales bacterium]|nr:PEP-CTERM sorting domain-containing protein [Planctomycetales bacterium]
MKHVRTITAVLLCTSALIIAKQAQAQPNLQITEMWPGGLPGNDATSDWIEVTNFGNAPATGLDGNLFYDDNSDDPLSADAMLGVDTIAPGESVVYLVAWENAFNNIQEDAVNAFLNMWSPPTSLQIGTVDFGGGLGAQGDAANIFDGTTVDAMLIDREEYSGPTDERSFVSDASGNWIPVRAQLGVLGAYQGNLSADDLGAPPPVGSPGIVPEPSSVFLLGLATAFAALRFRPGQAMTR